MEEAVKVKENVNPVGGGLLGPSRRERRFGRSGVGVGLARHESRRSRERAGVLTSNSTLGNGGGVEALEWLKDRVSQHKLVSKSSQPELDSGSRRLGKLVSPAVDGNDKLSGALGKPSAGLSFSKEVGGTMAGREQQQSLGSHPSPSRSRGSLSFLRNSVDHGGEKIAKNHRLSSGVQAGGAKSPWPVANRGVIEVYHDDSINSQEHHRVTSRSSNVKSVEIKSPVAASLLASRGLALRSDTGEHAKVSSFNSPSNVFLSKFQLHQDQVCVKKLSSPQSSSHDVGSGLWSGSKRPGTPFRSTEPQSRQDSVIDRPERSSRGEQQFSSSGQALGLNLTIPEIGRSSVALNDRREVSRSSEVKVEGGAADRLPSGAGRTVTVDSALRSHINQNGNNSYATKIEELKSRIQQGDFLSLYPRKSPPNSVDSSSRSNYGNKQQGPLYANNNALPEEEVASSPGVRISQCEGKNLQELVFEDEKGGGGGGVSEEEPVPHISFALESPNVEHYESLGDKIDCGSRAACDKIYKYAGSYSEEKVNKQAFARIRETWPQPAGTQSASTHQAGVQRSSKWARSNAFWSHAQADAHCPPSEQEVVPQDDALKGNTSSNTDITAVGQGSASLFSIGTGVSSSGSSSTRSLPENSSLDDDTVKSRDPTLLPDKEVSSSSRLSNVYKVSKISKRPKYLGRPASRVLRDSVESFNSSISSPSVSPIIESDCPTVTTAENVEKTSGAVLEHPSSDPRKRKAERDLTGGDGDTSQLSEHSSSAPPPASAQEKDVEVPFQAQRGQSLVGSTPREHPSPSISKQDVGKFARPRLPTTLVSPPAKSQQPRISATGRMVLSGNPSSVSTTSKATTAALAGRQSRTASLQSHTEVDAFEASKDSCDRRDRRHLQSKDGARESALPASKPSHGAQNGNEERTLLSANGPPNVEDGRDLAQDMSHDGLSSLENKENVPIPVVPDLSNFLNSLSLGEEDLLKKDESKLLLRSHSNRVSPTPCVAPSSQLITSKPVENSAAPPSKSHSARSVISVETSSRDQVQISPDGSENPKNYEPAGKSTWRSPIRSKNPGGDISNKAVGLPCNTEVKVRAFPSEESALASGAGALQASDGSGKENGQGATATPPKKMFENSYFVWVNNKRYQKLGRIGKGGSSEVFKVIDSDCNIYALKKINLKGREYRVALGFYQEIEYLERFRGKRNVIQLIDYEVTNRTVISEDYEEEKILEDAYIYMVLEFGEIDFASILIKKRKEMMESDEIIDENWLRFYWKHMLLAVKTIHEERIVHADLKPANFLLVKGELKLIDFGIAKAIQNDTTHIVRDSGVGTLNYMAPEAFMTNSIDDEGLTVKCGRASDIWSLGCILYQMVYGHTPFSHVVSFYAKIQAIACKTHKIQFQAIPDPWLLDAMKKCLTWDRHGRPQITDLLEHPFLRPELANQHTLAV